MSLVPVLELQSISSWYVQVQLEVEGHTSGARSDNNRAPPQSCVPCVQARAQVVLGWQLGPWLGFSQKAEPAGLVESAYFIRICGTAAPGGRAGPLPGLVLPSALPTVGTMLRDPPEPEGHQLQGSQGQKWRRPDQDTQDKSGCPVLVGGRREASGKRPGRILLLQTEAEKASCVGTRGANSPLAQNPPLGGCMAGP